MGLAQEFQSFKPKEPPEGGGRPSVGGRNAPADFRGKKRSNETHHSTTDPDARLYRKGRAWRQNFAFIGTG